MDRVHLKVTPSTLIMPFKYWFQGDIKTVEPVTQDILNRIADRIGVPTEGRRYDCEHYVGWGDKFERFFVRSYPYGIKTNTQCVTMYYNSEFDLKKVASVFEEELKATSGDWSLVGKWCKHHPVSEIIGACDCTGLDGWLCDDCLKTWPPTDSEGKRVMCLPGRECYVNGVKCVIIKGRYGEGIEITRRSDRLDTYHEKVEELKNRHALEIKDEAKDFDRVRKWHIKYAARRLKELDDLGEAFTEVTRDLTSE